MAYINASDAGLPRRGALRVRLNQVDPQVYLPASRWDAAAMPVLYINAAFHTHDSEAAIFWSTPGADFSESTRVSFPVIPDGQFHTYTVDLGASPAYRGVIRRLRFDPGNGGVPGDFVEIASISYRQDGGAARGPRVVLRPQ